MPVSKIPGTHIQEWWPFQISLFAEKMPVKCAGVTRHFTMQVHYNPKHHP